MNKNLEQPKQSKYKQIAKALTLSLVIVAFACGITYIIYRILPQEELPTGVKTVHGPKLSTTQVEKLVRRDIYFRNNMDLTAQGINNAFDLGYDNPTSEPYTAKRSTPKDNDSALLQKTNIDYDDFERALYETYSQDFVGARNLKRYVFNAGGKLGYEVATSVMKNSSVLFICNIKDLGDGRYSLNIRAYVDCNGDLINTGTSDRKPDYDRQIGQDYMYSFIEENGNNVINDVTMLGVTYEVE